MATSLADTATTRTLFPDLLEMSRPTAELIHALVQRVPNAGPARIIQLLYLVDLEAHRYLGQPLTPLTYVWHTHGPFDSDVLALLDVLSAQGRLDETKAVLANGKTRFRYKAAATLPPGETLRPAELVLVNFVASKYGKKKLADLLDDVYQTPPMERARQAGRRGALLKMEMVNNEARIPGAELETVLRSIDQLETGQGRSLQEIRANRNP